jgi:ADP-heptose:LPS heptosyltransferase
MSDARHVVMFRTDRIGDLVLTLPAAEAIRRRHPGARVTFMVQEYTRELALRSPFIDEVIAISDRDTRDVRGCARMLAERGFTHAVFAYPRPGLARAAWRAGIAMRIGTGYRWYSLLFTDRIREHRHDAARHESAYTLRLLVPLGVEADEASPPRLRVFDADAEAARTVLAASGIGEGQPFITMHPGSGGSAKDWSAERFGALARAMRAEDSATHVLVTGTRSERALMEQVARDGGEGVHLLAGDVQLPVLSAVLSKTMLFLSNSTGPLHIAAAHGVPIVGFYPFETACHPRRWGPIGTQSRVLAPEPDASCRDCARGRCSQHDDMARIAVGDALAAVHALRVEALSQGAEGTNREPAGASAGSEGNESF